MGSEGLPGRSREQVEDGVLRRPAPLVRIGPSCTDIQIRSSARFTPVNSASCPGSGSGSGSRVRAEQPLDGSPRARIGPFRPGSPVPDSAILLIVSHRPTRTNLTALGSTRTGRPSNCETKILRFWPRAGPSRDCYDFRSGSPIGATDRTRDTSLAPIGERQPAGGPSSGHPRSGCRSWAKRSVLTREQDPDPDPRKAARGWPVFGPPAIRLPVLGEKVRPGSPSEPIPGPPKEISDKTSFPVDNYRASFPGAVHSGATTLLSWDR